MREFYLEVTLMGKESNEPKKPLLYIQQPSLQLVKPKMQDMFKTRANEKSVKESKKKQKKQAEQTKEVSSLVGTLDEPKEKQDENEQVEQPREDRFGLYRVRHVKPFKELSVVEKIDYLSRFPSLIAPLPCEFVTKNGSVKGILYRRNNDQIIIRMFNGETKDIPLSQIKNIHMIGQRN
jgi:hypothetical protein